MDTSQYDKAMDDAIAKAKTLNDTLSGATVGGSASGGGGTTSTGSGMSAWKVTVGNLMSDVVRKGAQLAWDFTVEGIDLASAKNEVQNVVDVTFGSYSDALNEWAKSAKAILRPPHGTRPRRGFRPADRFARPLAQGAFRLPSTVLARSARSSMPGCSAICCPPQASPWMSCTPWQRA